MDMINACDTPKKPYVATKVQDLPDCYVRSSGIHNSRPARASEFRENIDVAIGIGDQLGCRVFNALYGNRVEGASVHEQDDLAVENLALAAKAAKGISATVLVESVSGAERYPLKVAADSISVLDRVQRVTGADNLGFLMDLFHLVLDALPGRPFRAENGVVVVRRCRRSLVRQAVV